MIKKISKIFSVLLAVAIIFSCTLTANASDRTIRCVNSDIVDSKGTISVEVSGEFNKSDVTSAKLGDKELTVKNTKLSSESSVTNLVYILVDNSEYNKKAYNATKSKIINYAASLSKDDKVVFMALAGTGKLEPAGTIDAGTEKSKGNVKKIVNKIKIKSTEKVQIYEAIDKAYQDSTDKSKFDRAYVLLFTAAVKLNTRDSSVGHQYRNHNMPVYAVLGDKSTETQGFLKGLCEKSGGAYKIYSLSKPEKAADSFTKLKPSITNNTLVTLDVSNYNGDKQDLELTVKGDDVYVSDYVANTDKDTAAPKIKNITYDKSSKLFIVEFNENVKVNTNSVDTCSVTKNGDKAYNVNIAAKKASANKVSISSNRTIYNGTYTFTMPEVSDLNGNVVKETEYKITDATPVAIFVLKIVGICLIPIAFLVALYLILLNLKKRKNVNKIKDLFVTQVEETETQQIHIEQPATPQGKKITLFIAAGSGRTDRIEYNLVSSMIIGRSNMCDVYVDDEKLSRQHFAIETVDTGLAITDLQTTNGTFVNGVQIYTRTFLNSGDKIFAGNSTITVNY